MTTINIMTGKTIFFIKFYIILVMINLYACYRCHFWVGTSKNKIQAKSNREKHIRNNKCLYGEFQ